MTGVEELPLFYTVVLCLLTEKSTCHVDIALKTQFGFL